MLNNLAAAHAVLGSTDASAAMHERALVIWEATHGPEHPLVATSLNNLGNVARERGSHDDAVRLYARARGIWERTLGPEHPNVVLPLIGTGEIALVRGHADEAVPLLERALQIREARHPVPADMAEARFALARALWDAPPSAGRDRPRARTLAHQARETYRDIDRAEPLSEVEAWLATRAR